MPQDPSTAANWWDQRYSDTFASYGTAPNDFVRAVAASIPSGPVLVIAAGEGRDAVFLAERGHAVTAVDLSPVGIANTNALAIRRGVTLTTIVKDLAEFDLGHSKWAGIVAVWAHLPAPLRKRVHAACVEALAPGGALIVEIYAPDQLQREGVGGPPDVDALLTPQMARTEFAGLEFLLCQQAERDVQEGRHHSGPSATTQVLGLKPLERRVSSLAACLSGAGRPALLCAIDESWLFTKAPLPTLRSRQSPLPTTSCATPTGSPNMWRSSTAALAPMGAKSPMVRWPHRFDVWLAASSLAASDPAPPGL